MASGKSTSFEEDAAAPDSVDPHGELTEQHAQAVLMRAEGATYGRIAEELGISEARAREYAPFPAQINAGQVREEMRVAIVMGDRNKLAEAYERYGVGIGEVIDQHRECLYADSYYFDKETGKFFAKPDYRTRMTAVNSYYRAIGVIGEVAQEGDAGKPVELHLHRDTVYKVENLTGRKILPEGDQRDGTNESGNGRTGGGHLPVVRTFSEPLPDGAGRPEPAALRDSPDAGADSAAASQAAGGDADTWGDW